jgi:hypothetical protein
MTDSYIEQAPGGETTSPAQTHKFNVTDTTTDYYLQLANLLKIIDGLTADTSPAIADEVATYDASASGPKKVTLDNLYKIINLLTEDTAPVVTDFLATYDTSASGPKKVSPDNLLKIINGLTADATPDFAADYVTTYDASASAAKKVLLNNANRIVQEVHGAFSAVATGTTTIPYDDTIPQNTEGTEFMSVPITPTNANNKLVIDVVFYGAASAVVDLILALFQDSTAGALAAVAATIAGVNYSHSLILRYEMTAGTTSATTFKLRAGGGAASTITMNGFGGARKFGTVAASSMRITEVKV